MSNRWTAEDDERLRGLYETVGVSESAATLGRSVPATYLRAARLGLLARRTPMVRTCVECFCKQRIAGANRCMGCYRAMWRRLDETGWSAGPWVNRRENEEQAA